MGCEICGERLRAGEARVCKSCRQAQNEKAMAQAPAVAQAVAAEAAEAAAKVAKKAAEAVEKVEAEAAEAAATARAADKKRRADAAEAAAKAAAPVAVKERPGGRHSAGLATDDPPKRPGRFSRK